MHDEHNETQLSDAERALFTALPRERAVEAGQEDHLIDALRAEGYFRKRPSTTRWATWLRNRRSPRSGQSSWRGGANG